MAFVAYTEAGTVGIGGVNFTADNCSAVSMIPPGNVSFIQKPS